MPKAEGAAILTRPATPADASAMAAIYNEGIRDRVATFETRERSPDEIARWFDGRHPIVVVESGREVIAFAATGPYRARECYAGVAECSVYVAGARRGQGAGTLALQGLIDAAAAAGFWKLLSRIFVENTASRALVARAGFREVGVYRRHARLDGAWRDVVIVERLLGEADR
ncbi:MAG TPA: arsinothricin resistance N-acetyltransferase ArsN1 family A [Vicinamibacterales bacterium]|nr:arsinothricin resistance N-acetyltransferase ArsN1 family A [Vicinamibacterales bacterium]